MLQCSAVCCHHVQPDPKHICLSFNPFPFQKVILAVCPMGNFSSSFWVVCFYVVPTTRCKLYKHNKETSLSFNSSCPGTHTHNNLSHICNPSLTVPELRLPTASGYLATVCCKLLCGRNPLLLPLLLPVWDTAWGGIFWDIRSKCIYMTDTRIKTPLYSWRGSLAEFQPENC